MGVGSRQVKQHCPGPSNHASRGHSSSGHGVKEHSTSPFWKREKSISEGDSPALGHRELKRRMVGSYPPNPQVKVTKKCPGRQRSREGESFRGAERRSWGDPPALAGSLPSLVLPLSHSSIETSPTAFHSHPPIDSAPWLGNCQASTLPCHPHSKP